jgi:kynurenine formamidase
VRVAADSAEYFRGEPGPGLDGARWLAERRIAAAGADNYAFEVLPPASGTVGPVHQFLIRDCGVPLIEGLLLDELAEAKVYEFLFVATPLPIVGGTASPVSPVAVA